jgi:hypothetical protein
LAGHYLGFRRNATLSSSYLVISNKHTVCVSCFVL